jgi:uncharacterized LabA/DUF88 family protein
MIFADNSNLFRGARSIGVHFRYEKLAKYLATKAPLQYDLDTGVYDLRRAFVYCSLDISKTREQQEFERGVYRSINAIPKFDVLVYDLKIIYDEKGCVIDKYEKGVDVALATDLLLMAANGSYDVAIVCCGDEDLKKAVEGVKSLGKEIYVAAFPRSCSPVLKDASLCYIDLAKHKDEIELVIKPK